MIERRKQKRFKVYDGASVVHPDHIGQILDISMGGLLCQCIGQKNPPRKPTVFDLFCANDTFKFKLKEVPIQMITNYINQLSPWNTTLVRRCGVMFGDLSPAQQSELENFIEHLANE